MLIEEVIPSDEDEMDISNRVSFSKDDSIEIPQTADENSAYKDTVENYRIALGRAWFQAPEVDGAVVVHFSEAQTDSEQKPITAGSLVRARITALHGIDLEAEVLS